jgi:hypothetical protein
MFTPLGTEKIIQLLNEVSFSRVPRPLHALETFQRIKVGYVSYLRDRDPTLYLGDIKPTWVRDEERAKTLLSLVDVKEGDHPARFDSERVLRRKLNSGRAALEILKAQSPFSAQVFQILFDQVVIAPISEEALARARTQAPLGVLFINPQLRDTPFRVAIGLYVETCRHLFRLKFAAAEGAVPENLEDLLLDFERAVFLGKTPELKSAWKRATQLRAKLDLENAAPGVLSLLEGVQSRHLAMVANF